MKANQGKRRGIAMKRMLLLCLATLLLGCGRDAKAPESVATSAPEPTQESTEEPKALRDFVEEEFSEQLAIFDKEQAYDSDDPDLVLKETLDRYLYCGEAILSDVNEPFSLELPYVSEKLSYCDDSFYDEALIVTWANYCIRRHNQVENGHDLTYQLPFEFRTAYESIEHGEPDTIITVTTHLKFRQGSADFDSFKGDTHCIHARNTEQGWRITAEDPGALAAHIPEQYHRLFEQCPETDRAVRRTWIMTEWTAKWGFVDPIEP